MLIVAECSAATATNDALINTTVSDNSAIPIFAAIAHCQTSASTCSFSIVRSDLDEWDKRLLLLQLLVLQGGTAEVLLMRRLVTKTPLQLVRSSYSNTIAAINAAVKETTSVRLLSSLLKIAIKDSHNVTLPVGVIKPMCAIIAY